MAYGYYHKHNVLLFRILTKLFEIYPERISARELADYLEVAPTDITDRIKSYAGFGYVVRSKKKYVDETTGRKVRLIRITKKGAKAYMNLKRRTELGIDLNRKKPQSHKVDCYFGITRRGAVEIGITTADIEKMNSMLVGDEDEEVEDVDDEVLEEDDIDFELLQRSESIEIEQLKQ
jgi:DNA-binding MarR family transcriptional regulator